MILVKTILSFFLLQSVSSFLTYKTIHPSFHLSGGGSCSKGDDSLVGGVHSLESRLYQTKISLLPDLEDDEKVRSLYAWISKALDGADDGNYNNVMLAFVAIFASPALPETSEPMQMLQTALKDLESDDERLPRGQAFSTTQREQASLGAMGAAQWTGQWKTRPHALLDVRNMTTVQDWVSTLPRGCKRTLKKALANNDEKIVTVTPQLICGGQPAPHSCLAHFRCVVEHEVRLLSKEYGSDVFFDALSEAINRYIGTTRMAGTIQEYTNKDGKVMALAHVVQKGRVLRGQWFYADNEAAQQYVWFHSVHQLVEKAINTPDVDVVDLGPSGTDSFSQLKERYGFVSVDDWPAVADYNGPFVYDDEALQIQDTSSLNSLLEQIMKRGNV